MKDAEEREYYVVSGGEKIRKEVSCSGQINELRNYTGVEKEVVDELEREDDAELTPESEKAKYNWRGKSNVLPKNNHVNVGSGFCSEITQKHNRGR